jgi:hypothetical protein
MFGQALSKLDGVQPQVPPGGKRPPYEETVPCETQKPISDLSASSSGPIGQANSSMSAPAAKARWNGANQNAVPALREIAALSGLKLNTGQMAGGSSQSGSGGGSGSGGSGSGGSGSGGSGSGGASSGLGSVISRGAHDVGQAISAVVKTP